MNERIKELAEQAGFQYVKDEGIGWAGNYNSSLSKFAELIVGQCVFELIHESTKQPNTVIQNFSVAVVDRIKQHFGIEK